LKGIAVLAFNIKTIKHTLRRVKKDKIIAVVDGRVLPTVETEDGRDAIIPSGAAAWATALGLNVYCPIPDAMQAQRFGS
jgi:hypothetical protein